MKLSAPPEFWSLSPAAREEICNGCGPGGWKGMLVPDNLLGCDIHEACDIHDYRYAVGTTEEERLAADLEFLANMMICIEADHKELLLTITRRELALDYYCAVRGHGNNYFSQIGMVAI